MQLWYNMNGKGMGTLNVYQQSEEGIGALIFSQTGDQGRLWRFAQAALVPRIQPYRVSHEYPSDCLVVQSHSEEKKQVHSLNLCINKQF